MSEQRFSLQELLEAAGREMSQDLRSRLVEHPGELGVGREEIIRRFLKSYLPGKFGVSTGFVFDCDGNLSKQVDIIIYDSSICPIFRTKGGIGLFPCEAVVAVGEVKSAISSAGKLHSALEPLESVKALDRSAKGSAYDLVRQEQLNPVENHLHQVFSFLFIVGRSLSTELVRDELGDWILRREPHLWPNIILSLDRYLVTFCCDDGVCPNPMHARGIAVQAQTEDHNLIQHFYKLLGRAIQATRVSSLPYWEYLSGCQKWTADVYFPYPEDPPRFLHDRDVQ